MMSAHEIALAAWEAWTESLERFDGSYADLANPVVGDLVLEITDGARALEQDKFMPASLGWLRERSGDEAVVEQLDGSVSHWQHAKFVRVDQQLLEEQP